MEFLSGESLKDLIEREAPMPVARAVAFIQEAADALDAAHRLGVVHRDLKPANLFLSRFEWGEKLKVLDFGIAKIVREAESETTRLTETGVFLGTYRYASPEQCMGESVTPASDVYSLAVTLFEMLAGRSLFDGPSSVLAIRHATTPPPRVDTYRSDVPEGLVEIIDRALSKEPGRRPATGGELAAALVPFSTSGGSAALPPPARSGPRRRLPADAFAPNPPSSPPPRAGSGTVLHGAPAVASAGKDPKSFSELLVREVAQFYPSEVAEGRRHKDIYRRLRNEIDIRWSLYTQRFPEEQTDYFYELLVEVLADGDVALFGQGFPSSTDRRRRRLQGR
jgi:serine/threonine-protein kinase